MSREIHTLPRSWRRAAIRIRPMAGAGIPISRAIASAYSATRTPCALSSASRSSSRSASSGSPGGAVSSLTCRGSSLLIPQEHERRAGREVDEFELASDHALRGERLAPELASAERHPVPALPRERARVVGRVPRALVLGLAVGHERARADRASAVHEVSGHHEARAVLDVPVAVLLG